MQVKKKRTDKYLYAVLLMMVAFFFMRFIVTLGFGTSTMAFGSNTLELFAIWGCIVCLGTAYVTNSLVRVRVQRGQLNSAHKLMQNAFAISFSMGIVAAALMFVGCRYLAIHLALWPTTYLCFICIALAFIFLSPIGVMRGYFQAIKWGQPAVFSIYLQIILTLLCGGIGCVLAYSYGRKVAALLRDDQFSYCYAACGLLLGISIASLLVFIFLLLIYLASRNVLASKRENDNLQYFEEMSGDLRKSFMRAMLLIDMIALFANLQVITNQRIYHYHRNLANVDTIAAEIGAFYGVAIPIVSILAILAVMPFLSTIQALYVEFTKEKFSQFRERFSMLMRLSAYMVIPCSLFIVACGENIYPALLGPSEVSLVMPIMGVSVFLQTMNMIFFLLFMKLGSMNVILFSEMTGFAIQTVAMFLFANNPSTAPISQALAYLINQIVLYAMTLILGRQIIFMKSSYLRGYVRIILSAAIAALPVYLLNGIIANSIGTFLSVVLMAILYFIIYIIVSIYTKAADLYYIDRIPGGKWIVKIAEVLNV